MSNPFEDFVGDELPKRISTNEDPTGVIPGKIPVTTGIGLSVKLSTTDEIFTGIKHKLKKDDVMTEQSVSEAFLVDSPPGNELGGGLYVKTGVVNKEKASKVEPPFIYNKLGEEYVERRLTSFQYIPTLVTDTTPKLVVESKDVRGNLLVISKKKSSGYVMESLTNNVTTNALDSLAKTGNDNTMWRVSSVLDVLSVVCSFMGNPTQSGTWTESSLGAIPPVIPAYDKGNPFLYLQTKELNAKLTFLNVNVINNKVGFSFIASNGGSRKVSITVDGVTTLLDLFSETVKVKTFEFSSFKEKVNVEIQHLDTNTFTACNYLGQYFTELKNWNETPIDRFGYYRTNALADFLLQNSENDWTSKEYKTGIYGGGYHGGEKNIENKIMVDGVETPLSLVPKVGRSIVINASCTVDWSSLNNDTIIKVSKEYIFTLSGYYSTVTIKGKGTFSELYSGLFGAPKSFSEIIAPVPMVINDNVENNKRLMLGRSNQAILRNPLTGQTINITYTVHQNDYANQYGGLYVWRVDSSYNKIYSCISHGGRLDIVGAYSRNKFEFENGAI